MSHSQTETLAKVVSANNHSELDPVSAAHKYLELRRKMEEMRALSLVVRNGEYYADLLLETCALSGQFCEEWAKLAIR